MICLWNVPFLSILLYFAVMGKALSIGLDLIGTGRSVLLDKEFQNDIKNLELMTESQSDILTPREKDHVKAISAWASGYIFNAFLNFY